MSLPFDWDFLQDNLPQEKLAELRRRFMKEWRSGAYTRKEMIERYRMSERTFWYTIKRYADAKELDDYNKTPAEVRIAATLDNIHSLSGDLIKFSDNAHLFKPSFRSILGVQPNFSFAFPISATTSIISLFLLSFS